MYEDKDSRGLLLLRVGSARFASEPRLQLRQHGPPDDRSHQVIAPLAPFPTCQLHTSLLVDINRLQFQIMNFLAIGREPR